MTSFDAIILVASLLSIIISFLMAYIVYRYWFLKESVTLRNKISEIELMMEGSKSPVSSLRDHSSSGLKRSGNDRQIQEEIISEELKKKRDSHLQILKKVADDMIKSFVDPWPIASLSTVIPAIPKRNERPLWDDLSTNHLSSINRNFAEQYDRYNTAVLDYARYLPNLLRMFQSALLLTPEGIVKDIDVNIKDSPDVILYRKEFLFGMINFRLGFQAEPDIKFERKVKRIGHGSSHSILYMDNIPMGIVPDGMNENFSKAMESTLNVDDEGVELASAVKEVMQLKKSIITLKQEAVRNLNEFLKTDALFGGCSLI
ncbi:MAG: hypothetical protein ACYCR7_02920 [Thermoplasmataceae archaeon]